MYASFRVLLFGCAMLPLLGCAMLPIMPAAAQESSFHLNERGYLERGGVDVMSFQDFYPDGHQGGV